MRHLPLHSARASRAHNALLVPAALALLAALSLSTAALAAKPKPKPKPSTTKTVSRR